MAQYQTPALVLHQSPEHQLGWPCTSANYTVSTIRSVGNTYYLRMQWTIKISIDQKLYARSYPNPYQTKNPANFVVANQANRFFFFSSSVNMPFCRESKKFSCAFSMTPWPDMLGTFPVFVVWALFTES